jgi:hypothetical protein
MRRLNIHGSATVQNAWYAAWTNNYSLGEAVAGLRQIAYNRWTSGGARNTCLVLVKPTIPWVGPGGVVISYRWQTRALTVDGCRTGWFVSRPVVGRGKGRALRFEAPAQAADRRAMFCAPLSARVGGADPAGSLARRLIGDASQAESGPGELSSPSLLAAIAPQAVKAAAARAASAIESGRAAGDASVLGRPGPKAALGLIDRWAAVHC